MNIQPLVKTDLNLLVTLYAILEERSVSRAADKLYVTQSAVSRSLSKMRDLFDDPLFTRTGHQMVPTPFLKEMEPLLITTLNNANSILQPPVFDPRSWHGSLKMHLTESMEMVLLPKLLGYLQKHAAGIAIETSHFGSNTLEQLANGDLDIAISHDYSHYPEEFIRELFFTTTTAILVRDDHPLQGTEQPYAEVQKYPKVSLRIPDWEKTHIFHTLSQTRDSILGWDTVHDADSLLSAVSIVRATDCLLPVPDMLALEVAETGRMRFFTIKEYEDVSYDYVIITHQRIALSPVHQWFKKILLELGCEIGDERDEKLH